MSAESQQKGNAADTGQPPHRYNAAMANRIERTWQANWDGSNIYATPNPGEPGFDGSRPKQFVLDMFPYPSGVGLHVGHPLGYIATDIYARFLRMSGCNVLHTMGFDSFGLPAEQYAVQTGTHPRVTTERNIATMRSQLKRLGLGHDPRRSVSTTDPNFYKWTQWIFLRLYDSWYDDRKGGGASDSRGRGEAAHGRARPISELITAFERGEIPTRSGRAWGSMDADERREEIDARRLAYLAEVPVNWCPMLGTVLANEEVTNEGRSERGNYPVYKRPLKQWMMRITAYAERLAADLDRLDWPEAIKIMQRNWIGRSEGAEVLFQIAGDQRTITVFTTRPDTLFGATYMVLSPEHPLVDHLVQSADEKGESSAKTEVAFSTARFPDCRGRMSARDRIGAYRAYAATKSDDQRAEAKEKTGAFTGAYAINPVNGERIPIYIADYVLMNYGTGAIMAVPAHDERDWEFAKAFNLPIVHVYTLPDGSTPDGCFSGDGIAINSSRGDLSLDGLPTHEAKNRITAWLESRSLGRGKVTYKLRDWLFSRQRYWGEPFPIVYDETGVAHALPESMLPVLLPDLENFQPESSEDPDAPPRPPLARARQWTAVELDLGEGRKKYTRETNTMPNWAGSCWYYLRYLDPTNDREFCATDVERYWMGGQTGSVSSATRNFGGVDLYVGGVEHAVLHLLYARFWHKVLFDLGHVSTPEPFQRLFNQGYIQAAAYTDDRGVYVEATEVQERDGSFFHKGKPVTREYGKMGKSLKNAVTPDDICAEYGCDTLRLYEMSMGPLEASKPWNTRDIVGSYRFLQKVWRNLIDEQTGASRVAQDAPDRATLRVLHKTIMGVRRDMSSLGFNTVVSKLIELNNHLSDLKAVPMEAARGLILMLAPLAPHIAEELWSRVVGDGVSVVKQPFPIADASLAADDEVEIPVSIMGKLRHRITVPAGTDSKGLEAAALAEPRVKELIEGKVIKKVIVVPGKMVNIVHA